MSHDAVCRYHYRGIFGVWLTTVTVWLFSREGVAKCPCKCGSVSEIYKLEEFLCKLPLDDNNAVFNLCCRLCSAYEQKAFVDGIKYGMYLMVELK